jgi:Transposase
MVITAWLGIDIAKQKFDVALNWNTRRRAKVFRNDAEGWQALLRWLKDLGVDQVHACLEATGRYGDGLALHLHEAGHRVSVVNPAQIKHFGRVKLGRNKTDRADAALICDYCRLFEPAAWTPPSAALRQLRDLPRGADGLPGRVRRGSGQGSTAADTAMAGVIARLEAEIAALNQAIVHVIGQDEDLRARHDLLISVPGIATHTAAVILSELPGCCARRGRRRPMPVSIRAIGILARRAVPDLPDRQRHFAGGPLSSRPRRAPLEPAGGRPASAPEGPGPAQAQADRRSRDAQAAASVLRRAQDRQTVRSRSCNAY